MHWRARHHLLHQCLFRSILSGNPRYFAVLSETLPIAETSLAASILSDLGREPQVFCDAFSNPANCWNITGAIDFVRFDRTPKSFAVLSETLPIAEVSLAPSILNDFGQEPQVFCDTFRNAANCWNITGAIDFCMILGENPRYVAVLSETPPIAEISLAPTILCDVWQERWRAIPVSFHKAPHRHHRSDQTTLARSAHELQQDIPNSQKFS